MVSDAESQGPTGPRRWILEVCPTSGSAFCCACDIEGEWVGDTHAELEYVEPSCPAERVEVVEAGPFRSGVCQELASAIRAEADTRAQQIKPLQHGYAWAEFVERFGNGGE